MSSKKLRVGVIFGGKSSEKEVSLATGRYVYSLVDKQKFEAVPYFMDAAGLVWRLPDKLVIQNTTKDIVARLDEAKQVYFQDLKKQVDLMFVALLGKYGEDGCIQGVLELLQIPYTGSGILASALGMDKRVHKMLLRQAGFMVPEDLLVGVRNQELGIRDKSDKEYVVSSSKDSRFTIQDSRGLIKLGDKELGWPVVVKPTREGSSVGVSVVKKAEQLEGAIKKALEWDEVVLVEEYIKGLEFTCVVWGNESPTALLPTEVVFTGDFFDYESKYMPGKAQTITPARVSDEMLRKIQETAEGVYALFRIKGYGRVDGYVKGEKVYIAEPHTGTIMVPSSFVFQQAAQYRIELEDEYRGAKKVNTGLSPKDLVTKIIELAQEAHKGKKGTL